MKAIGTILFDLAQFAFADNCIDKHIVHIRLAKELRDSYEIVRRKSEIDICLCSLVRLDWIGTGIYLIREIWKHRTSRSIMHFAFDDYIIDIFWFTGVERKFHL